MCYTVRSHGGLTMSSNKAEDGLTRREVALHLSICLVIFAASLWVAIVKCNGWWVTNSGALIVMAGILMEYAPILRTQRAQDLPMWSNQRSHDANRMAISIVIFGTLVWAFGDCPVGPLGNVHKKMVDV